MSLIQIGPLAVRVVVHLEQVAFIRGKKIAEDLRTNSGRCQTAFTRDIAETLEELISIHFVEISILGCNDARLVCCMPALERHYRLNTLGYEWKCAYYHKPSGLYLPSQRP